MKNAKRKTQNSKLILLTFIFFSLLGCNSLNQPVTMQPSQVADPYSWDFGEVKEGTILKHNFVLKNESKNTLTIKDVNTSCGCIVSQVENKILSPGETTFIEVQFNTKGYSGPTQQFVYVHTDNLDNPILRFIIKASVLTLSRINSGDSQTTAV